MLARVSVVVLLSLALMACKAGFFRSGNNDLAALTITRGEQDTAVTLDPSFSKDNASYQATVSNSVDVVKVSAKLDAPETSTLTINGESVASEEIHSVDIDASVTTIRIRVTAENEAYRTYTVVVNKSSTTSSDATLSALSLSDIDLESAFSPETTVYELTSSYFVDRTAVTATTTDPAAGVSFPKDVSLPAGSTTSFSAVVTAGDDSQKTYKIEVTRGGVDDLSTAYIKALDSDGGDRFGAALATGGGYLVVGAPSEDGGVPLDSTNDGIENAGAIYIYELVAPSEPDYRKAATIAANKHFGAAVAISGDTIVVGAPGTDTVPGEASLFTHTGSTWSLASPLPSPLPAPGNGDEFGYAVALQGNFMAISAPGANSDQGAVHIYTHSSNQWSPSKTFTAPDSPTAARFGEALAFNPTSTVPELVIGAPGGAGGGAVYTVQYSNDAWPDQLTSVPINSLKDNDSFGKAVLLVGDRLLVGAPGEDGTGTGWRARPDTAPTGSEQNSGAVFVFARASGSTDSWTALGSYIKPPEALQGMSFGRALSFSGRMLVVGAPGQSTNTGAVYLFEDPEANNSWVHTPATSLELKPEHSDEQDLFGQAVVLKGRYLFVAAEGEGSDADGVNDPIVGSAAANDAAANAGAVYWFK